MDDRRWTIQASPIVHHLSSIVNSSANQTSILTIGRIDLSSALVALAAAARAGDVLLGQRLGLGQLALKVAALQPAIDRPIEPEVVDRRRATRVAAGRELAGAVERLHVRLIHGRRAGRILV